MSNYTRSNQAGGTFFFTVNLATRGQHLLVDEIDALRFAYARAYQRRPFQTQAIVVLPDHLHAVWRLPPGDADFSTRWKEIKCAFAKTIGPQPRSHSKRAKGELGVWQRRFWEHTIRDATDWQHHIAYALNNPVKHGLVSDAAAWPYSSIDRDLAAGRDWRT